jgi:hypothetical protein
LVTRQQLYLRGYGASETAAHVDVEPLVPGQRLARALSGFGLWFLAAVAVAFIPVAHFILVPLCLIGAFATLVMRTGMSVIVRASSGTCPDCGATQQLDIQGTWRLPKDVACKNCHRRLTLHA